MQAAVEVALGIVVLAAELLLMAEVLVEKVYQMVLMDHLILAAVVAAVVKIGLEEQVVLE